jgi:DNA-binding CsgD family transcriptional regulator
MAKQLNRKPRRKPRQRAIIVARQTGEIQFADQPARRWLKEFFGRPRQTGKLPSTIIRWASIHNRPGLTSLLAKKSNAQLYVKRDHSYTEDSVVLLLELIKGKSQNRLRQHRELTHREREVLFWLRKGKSNAEIGQILGIATATIGKHLEHIYPKLGVENRAGAASCDLQD